MQADLLLRLILLVTLLLLSGFFSGSETALFSLGPIQKRRIGTGTTGVDRSLRWLLGQPRRLIVTLLVGNELVNISVSTVVASLAHDAAPTVSPLTQVALSMAVAVPLLLVFGEVTPKSIAIKVPEGWSRAVARPLRAFAVLITPLRLFVRTLADGLINLLGGKPPLREKPLSEEEFIALVEVGSKGGELEKAEKDLIYNVFEFGDLTVGQVMTPGKDAFAISFSLPLDRIVAEVISKGYSRVPVYKGKRWDVVGILYAKDLVGFGQVLELSGKRLEDLLRKPFFVPKSTKLSRLFREFQNRRIHIAIVVDEYGSMVGVVTMEDLLEELFGELVENGEKVRRQASLSSRMPSHEHARDAAEEAAAIEAAGEAGKLTTPQESVELGRLSGETSGGAKKPEPPEAGGEARTDHPGDGDEKGGGAER